MDKTVVRFEYENYKGVKATRTVFPAAVWFGSTAYYVDPRWLLKAFDLDRRAVRDFDVGRIRNWRRAIDDAKPPETA